MILWKMRIWVMRGVAKEWAKSNFEKPFCPGAFIKIKEVRVYWKTYQIISFIKPRGKRPSSKAAEEYLREHIIINCSKALNGEQNGAEEWTYCKQVESSEHYALSVLLYYEGVIERARIGVYKVFYGTVLYSLNVMEY